MAAARLVELMFHRLRFVMPQWYARVDDVDGYPSTASGADTGRGSGASSSSVEAAVFARWRWTSTRTEAMEGANQTIRAVRLNLAHTVRIASELDVPIVAVGSHTERVAWMLPPIEATFGRQGEVLDLHDEIREIAAFASIVLNACDRLTGRAEYVKDVCSTGSGRDGYLDPYDRHSQAEDNGWSDPTCTNIIGRHPPLCDACYQRERRWRKRHNLTERNVA